MRPILTLPMTAESALTAKRIVKFGSADLAVALASANTDAIMGVTGQLGTDANAVGDIIVLGEAEVVLGGSVSAGDMLTSDSAGAAVEVTDAMLASAPVNAIGRAKVDGVAGDTIPVLVAPHRISSYTALTAGPAELNKLDGAPLAATITVGTESANAVAVAIQLKDGLDADLGVRGSVLAYLSDDANGDSVVATAPNGGVAIGTDGVAIPLVAGKVLQLVSEVDGDIDLVVTDSGTKNCYLILVLPTGKLVASAVIATAA